jgi:hypothetical protein
MKVMVAETLLATSLFSYGALALKVIDHFDGPSA